MMCVIFLMRNKFNFFNYKNVFMVRGNWYLKVLLREIREKIKINGGIYYIIGLKDLIFYRYWFFLI